MTFYKKIKNFNNNLHLEKNNFPKFPKKTNVFYYPNLFLNPTARSRAEPLQGAFLPSKGSRFPTLLLRSNWSVFIFKAIMGALPPYPTLFPIFRASINQTIILGFFPNRRRAPHESGRRAKPLYLAAFFATVLSPSVRFCIKPLIK